MSRPALRWPRCWVTGGLSRSSLTGPQSMRSGSVTMHRWETSRPRGTQREALCKASRWHLTGFVTHLTSVTGTPLSWTTRKATEPRTNEAMRLRPRVPMMISLQFIVLANRAIEGAGSPCREKNRASSPARRAAALAERSARVAMSP